MRQPQLDPRIAAFLAPKIRPPRIIGMQSLDLTPAELGQPPVAAPAAPAPAAAPSMRGQPRPGTPSPYDGDLLQGTDAEPRAPGRRFNTADVLAGIAAAASQLNGNPGAIDAWRSSREARSAKEAERARRARIQSMADELGLEGRERLAFEIDPEKWITEFGAPEEEKIAFIDLPDGRRVAVFDRILRGVMSGQLPYSALTGTSVGPQGAAPGVQQELPDVLPELPAGARVTPPRPTEAPATVGAAPQGISYRAPFDMEPSSRFGPRTPPRTRTGQGSRNHAGIDYPVGVGTPVPAAADGTVEFVGQQNGYGNVVRVRHPDGSVTHYAHLSDATVRRGDPVRAGQPIGKSGDTGNVNGPHLHFGAYDAQGRPFDPSSRYGR